MTADSPADVAAQYATDDNLRVRIRTHERYGAGPDLEAAVDLLLNLRGEEALLDVGTGPGDFPGRLRMGGHRGRLVGADLSPGMVEKARSAYPTASFVRADAAALPFPAALRSALMPRFQNGPWRVSKRLAFILAGHPQPQGKTL